MASVYYDAYKAGYRAGEVDAECSAPEGNGLTSYIGTPGETQTANLDAWEEAQRWGYQNGLEGDEMKSEVAVEGWLDNEFCI